MKNLKPIGVSALICLCLLSSACSPRKSPGAASSAAPAASASQASALVVFLEGKATAVKEADYKKLDIGQTVGAGWRIDTASNSSCDLKIGTLGTLRIMSKSSIELSSIIMDQGSRALSIKLVSGSVAAKVAKLGARDRFGVTTQAAACSVRGTEFIVAVEEDGATRLAVKEGFVAVLPPALDPMALGEGAAADAVYGAILDAVPAIKAGEEASFHPKDLEASAAAWEKALPKIESLVKKEGGKTDSSGLLASPNLKKALEPFLAAEAPLSSAAEKAGEDSVKDFEQLQRAPDPGMVFKPIDPVQGFDDAAFDGSWDKSKWIAEGPIDFITPRQAGGALRFEQTAPMPSVPNATGAGVNFVGNFIDKIPLRDYSSFGAVLKIAKVADSSITTTSINIRVPGGEKGEYWIAAVLYTIDEKRTGMGGRVDYYGSASKNEYLFNLKRNLAIDQDYNLRVDIDRAMKTVAWFLDGEKVAESPVPSLDANLDSPAQLLINSWRNTGALARTEARKVYWTKADK